MGKAPQRNLPLSATDQAWMESQTRAAREQKITARLYGTSVQCPSCADIMRNADWKISCQNENCDLYGRKFEIPTIELVPAKKPESELGPTESLAEILRDLANTIERRGIAEFSATDTLGRSSATHRVWHSHNPRQTFTAEWDWKK